MYTTQPYILKFPRERTSLIPEQIEHILVTCFVEKQADIRFRVYRTPS